jgi:hypothetical protein
MTSRTLLLTFLGLMLAPVLSAAPARAQATRTWVSGVGDDANPCSRTAPCKTFAGAISKTAAGGEIDCLDPGGFGAVTITKSITIDCTGTFGSILNAGGVNGVNVNAANIRVVLRGLSINGAGTGLNGINFINGSQLSVERCIIFGQTGNAITVNLGVAADLYVTNTYITTSGSGIAANSSVASVFISVDNTSILNVNQFGFAATNNIVGTITNSTVASASSGVIVAGTSQINVDTSTLINNATALNAFNAAAVMRVSNSNIYNNGSNFNIVAGAQILSTGNNRTTASGGTPNPTGTIPLK